jgi:DNA-directed RNA polymerase subunit M/transcription elongation factor TFIIS
MSEEYITSEIRTECMNKLNDIINNEDLSKKIEQSCYDYSYEKSEDKSYEFRKEYFIRIYINKLTSLYTNLDYIGIIGNTNLLSRFESEELDPEKAAYYKREELFPEHWKELRQKKNAQNDFLYMKQPEIITDEYQCGRCKERKCTYYTLQTRSCDEPATLFVTCLNCGKKW